MGAERIEMDLLLHNLRTIGTHHCDQTVGEEAAHEIERLRDMQRTGDTCARHCEGTAYRIEARQQKHRADVLAATIRELRDVVTHDAETKAEFIARVRAILSADPDARVPNAGIQARP